MEKVANTPPMVGSDGERLPILAKLRKSNLPKIRKLPRTLLASAKRNGLNEFAYLCDVLNRLADLDCQAKLHDLLPDKWNPETGEGGDQSHEESKEGDSWSAYVLT